MKMWLFSLLMTLCLLILLLFGYLKITHHIQVENPSSYSNSKNIDFDDILLIVNYNHPHYGSIEFIKDLYSAFPNIVFYGTEPHSSIINGKTQIVMEVPTHNGYFFSKVISDALMRFPNYRGYIFLQDDVLMNYWNFSKFDKEKIWFSIPNYLGSDFNSLPKSWHPNFDKTITQNAFYNWPSDSWYWWNTPWGIQPLEESMKQLEPKDRKILSSNLETNVRIGMWCDMFYLPQKFREDAIRLADIYCNVFCEIAIPMMLASLDQFHNWEVLKSNWHLNLGNRSYPISEYSLDIDWIHPLKFSDQNHRNFARDAKEAQKMVHQKD